MLKILPKKSLCDQALDATFGEGNDPPFELQERCERAFKAIPNCSPRMLCAASYGYLMYLWIDSLPEDKRAMAELKLGTFLGMTRRSSGATRNSSTLPTDIAMTGTLAASCYPVMFNNPKLGLLKTASPPPAAACWSHRRIPARRFGFSTWPCARRQAANALDQCTNHPARRRVVLCSGAPRRHPGAASPVGVRRWLFALYLDQGLPVLARQGRIE